MLDRYCFHSTPAPVSKAFRRQRPAQEDRASARVEISSIRTLRVWRAAPSSESIVSLMMFLSIVTFSRALVPFNASEGLFDGRGQRVVINVEDEDSEQLCRLCLARVAADRMDRARRFGPALACPIDARLAVIHLRLDRARDHIGVDESRLPRPARNRPPRRAATCQGYWEWPPRSFS